MNNYKYIAVDEVYKYRMQTKIGGFFIISSKEEEKVPNFSTQSIIVHITHIYTFLFTIISHYVWARNYL